MVGARRGSTGGAGGAAASGAGRFATSVGAVAAAVGLAAGDGPVGAGGGAGRTDPTGAVGGVSPGIPPTGNGLRGERTGARSTAGAAGESVGLEPPVAVLAGRLGDHGRGVAHLGNRVVTAGPALDGRRPAGRALEAGGAEGTGHTLLERAQDLDGELALALGTVARAHRGPFPAFNLSTSAATPARAASTLSNFCSTRWGAAPARTS